MDRCELEALVRSLVVQALAQGNPSFEKTVDPSGILSVRAATVHPEPFDTGKPGDDVKLTDIVTLEESPRLGCGIMEMNKTTFEWTLKYDEVDYIIDGTLEILIDGRKVVGHRGDVIFIPANSSISFSAPEHSRFLFVTYPADWASQ
ncbi:MAG: ethanolamine utilization protein [Dethiosulfovibrio peptidovorans]|nr:MAG: ethanolamine utilization protein [Dethiosulfovibrio peptidovorans]